MRITVCSNCLPQAANERYSLMSYDITLQAKTELSPLARYRSRGFLAPRSRCDKKIGHPFGCPIFLWSGLRGSNPPPSPWQGDALPNELNPHFCGASGRNRTNDTGIFSPLLYRLSYRGICHRLLMRLIHSSNFIRLNSFLLRKN